MKQKVFLFVLCLTLLLCITPVSAQQSNGDTNSNSNFVSNSDVQLSTTPNNTDKIEDTLLSIKYYPVPDNAKNLLSEKLVKSEKDMLYKGFTDKNGDIANIDPDKIKQALLSRWSKDPDKYEDSIKNIDEITEKFVEQLEREKSEQGNVNSIQNRDANAIDEITDVTIAASGIPICCYVTSYWDTGHPYKVSTQNRVTWNSWILEDNYRSSVPINVSYAKTSKVTASLGFTGAAEIKAKLSFSASFTVEQSATFTVGTAIPAWTAWAYRPYIKYTVDTWKGTMFYEYYSIPDLAWVYTYRYYDGENRIQTVKANEYWSRYNSTNNTSASTPALPTTQP